MSDYRRLEVWKRGVDFAVDIYRATESLPKHELYGLVTDMRRAAVSISKNVSEGHGRNHVGEFIQFVGISIGSSCELDTQLEMTSRLNYFAPELVRRLQDERGQLYAMLTGLKRSLERKQRPSLFQRLRLLMF